jgi:hypothetical protein
MNSSHLIGKAMVVSFCMLFYCSVVFAQAKSESPKIDMQKASEIIERIDNQFSKDYLAGDSLAVAGHYATDGQFGALKGKDILLFWGKSIRNSIKNNRRNLLFTRTSLTQNDEFLVETGIFEVKDDKFQLINKGKFLVVWKLENGEWKIYRDMGL